MDPSVDDTHNVYTEDTNHASSDNNIDIETLEIFLKNIKSNI